MARLGRTRRADLCTAFAPEKRGVWRCTWLRFVLRTRGVSGMDRGDVGDILKFDGKLEAEDDEA